MTECDLYCQGTESLHHLRRPCTRDTEEFQETRKCEAGWRWFQFERAASVSWSAASLSQASASRIVAVIQISLEDNQSCSQKSYKTERDVIYVNVCLYNVSKLHIWSEKKVLTGSTNKQTNIQTNKQTNRQTNKQTDRQTNKQTNKQTLDLLPACTIIIIRDISKSKKTSTNSVSPFWEKCKKAKK